MVSTGVAAFELSHCQSGEGILRKIVQLQRKAKTLSTQRFVTRPGKSCNYRTLVTIGSIIASMLSAHYFPEMGFSSKIEGRPSATRAKRSKKIPQVDCDIWKRL
jgi:hypothetical protein